MERNFYSNKDFRDLVNRINAEFKRRSTYKWYNPLTPPTVGEDRTPPRIEGVKDYNGDTVNPPLTEGSYTINNPSNMSFSPTRNISHEAVGLNPAGVDGNEYPTTSAAAWTVDEVRNFLIGLSRIKDIDFFYGLDEEPGLAFRDPQKIEDFVRTLESEPVSRKTIRGILDSEYEGEEIDPVSGKLGPHNFFDDYGIPVGAHIEDGEKRSFGIRNPGLTPLVRRNAIDQDNHRNDIVTTRYFGGNSMTSEGTTSEDDFNPRNPMKAKYRYSNTRAIYAGSSNNSCVGACTGLCYQTCDNQCSESCSTTCYSRCGNACTSSCGQKCGTGCDSSCEMSCSTGCRTKAGYSCVNAGAETATILTSGGKDGIPASVAIRSTTFSCSGCSYSCQFYPNRKTTCWDAGCMSQCFISCSTGCATSCTGACIGADSYSGGTGCSTHCTMNCVQQCHTTCEIVCTQTCFSRCTTNCTDNCLNACTTQCGTGCANGCTVACKGCTAECVGTCAGLADARYCSGCSSEGGCAAECMFGCNNNCLSVGCRGVCASDSSTACDSNCRSSCYSSSCTSLCENQCTDRCTTCVNTCGHSCGACTGECDTSCSMECNLNCSLECANSCSQSCLSSCTEGCNGCTNLCYSCTAECIGICSFRCEVTCTLCANNCTHWCDTSCEHTCFNDCILTCHAGCSESCLGTVIGRTGERESFRKIKEENDNGED